MKRLFRINGPNMPPPLKGLLAGLTKKTRTLFAHTPDEDRANIVILDKGTARLAQTRFGRQLLRWSRPSEKRKKKRRVPVFTLIFLALFAVMVIVSFVTGNHSASAANDGSAASMSSNHAVSATNAGKTTADPPPKTGGSGSGSGSGTSSDSIPMHTGKCPDGTAEDSNSHLCDPSTFDPQNCPGGTGMVDPADHDECDPWGPDSSYTGSDKGSNADIWEGVTPADRICIYTDGQGTDSSGNESLPDKSKLFLRNSDITWRGSSGTTGTKENTHTSISCKQNADGVFPCVTTETTVQKDWLSGDATSAFYYVQGAPKTVVIPTSGHLETTFKADTLDQQYIQQIYPYMLGAGFLLLIPAIFLSGYKLIISGSSFRHAEALAFLPRILIAGAAIAISSSLVGLFIDFSNDISSSVTALHQAIPYPAAQAVTDTNKNVTYYIGYTLTVENGQVVDTPSDPTNATGAPEAGGSYRGIVMPIVRWGCAANDFVGILSTSFWTNVVASLIPFFGNFVSLAEKISTAIELVHHLGEFVVAILSIGLAGQVIFRIIMINFYILTGPLACGCWALPGGSGQEIFSQWAKGIFSLLLTQAAQLFVLTVAPLVMPDFSKINFPLDNMGLLSSVFAALPVIIVLFVALQVPKFIGTSATKAVASAGTMASGAVAAGAAAAYSIAAG